MFICRTIQGCFPLHLARTRGRNFQWSSQVDWLEFLAMLKSPRFSIWTGGLNCDCVQGSYTKLLSCNFLITATRLPSSPFCEHGQTVICVLVIHSFPLLYKCSTAPNPASDLCACEIRPLATSSPRVSACALCCNIATFRLQFKVISCNMVWIAYNHNVIQMRPISTWRSSASNHHWASNLYVLQLIPFPNVE